MNDRSAFKRTWAALAKRGPLGLSRLAAVVALVGLLIMSISVVVPRPLPVILAMSVGQVIGAVALLSYFFAIVLEVRRHERIKQAPVRPTDQANSVE